MTVDTPTPATRQQLYAVLIALAGDTLLLPNLAVAEVVARDAVQPNPRLPPWLPGLLEWNGRRLPVLRFEPLNRGEAASDPRRERLVVLNSNGRHLPSGQFALVTQAYPHLVTLNRAALQPLPLRERDRPELLLARARVANQEALIPDLDMLEAEIARALTTAGV
ncbi:chemotaxis protein CheW [Solimonas variicoloris]|uniref:chemotaxis protein CheW n=1 Tax=Solimonas variicoloris TaxID=254408 RepID=UPI000373AD54|nr:chemotaxis protein CheW [Solimonas variicoloris]